MSQIPYSKLLFILGCLIFISASVNVSNAQDTFYRDRFSEKDKKDQQTTEQNVEQYDSFASKLEHCIHYSRKLAYPDPPYQLSRRITHQENGDCYLLQHLPKNLKLECILDAQQRRKVARQYERLERAINKNQRDINEYKQATYRDLVPDAKDTTIIDIYTNQMKYKGLLGTMHPIIEKIAAYDGCKFIK